MHAAAAAAAITNRVAATPIAICATMSSPPKTGAWVADGRVGAILMLSSHRSTALSTTRRPDSPINGPGLYGASKLFAERVLAGNDCGVPVIAARLPGVIGPAAPRNWLRAVLAKLRAGAEVAIFNPTHP